MTRSLHHWMDGRAHVDDGSPRITVEGPLDRQPVATVPVGSEVEVDAAVTSALRARQDWRDKPPFERGRLLAAIARGLRDRQDEFVRVEVSETGKLEREMVGGLHTSADYFEYYGGVVRALFGQTINIGAGDHAFTDREPYGVVGMITPWNGPLTQASRGVAAALAAGNTVVLKPSEFTSSTTVMLAELASEVGVPPGVLNVVLGTGQEVGAAITRHPDVRLLAFTGSAGVGRQIAREAAERLVPTILELGGKSANLVFADADLDKAVSSAMTICVGAGQQCAALSRLLVQDVVYEEFVARVGEVMKARRPGPDLAPMTTEAQFEKVVEYFGIAESEGARLVAGGKAVTGELARGRYVEPTLYADVTPQMRIFREEIFGPVLAVTQFRDEAEAIELANDSDFGLVASVWTSDSARGLRVASRLEAGQVLVNGGRSGIETPFGGYKSSGLGREKGFESLMHYTQVKTTVVATRE